MLVLAFSLQLASKRWCCPRPPDPFGLPALYFCGLTTFCSLPTCLHSKMVFGLGTPMACCCHFFFLTNIWCRGTRSFELTKCQAKSEARLSDFTGILRKKEGESTQGSPTLSHLEGSLKLEKENLEMVKRIEKEGTRERKNNHSVLQS